MFNLKKILVCLDLSKMDEFLIRYTALLASTMKSQEVYFFHVNEQLELPDSVGEKYPELYGPVDNTLLAKMRKSVDQHFPNHEEYGSNFVLKDGNSASQRLLEWSEIQKIDLIVMGKKSELRGKGINPKKIANISHCSVLFVPESETFSMDRLFVPVDFSENSTSGFEQAQSIQKNNGAQIVLQHVYYVPQGYHKTGKSYEQFAIIMRENAERDYKKYMKRHSFSGENCHDVYTLDDDDAPADKIYLEALNQRADLIIISSRGRTKAASLLLGSVALELLKYDKSIPYMVIKDKTENMSFFQALMKV